LPPSVEIADVEIWFQDETRVGQQGSLTRVWHYCGERPRLIRQQQYMSQYIFGAVCPEKGTSAGLIVSHVNKKMMALHMEEISKQVGRDKHAVVVMDGALWHQTDLNLANVTLLKLPPYSPELNPMEQVWQMMKQRFLSNRSYKDINTIVEACCSAWKAICESPDIIQTLTQRKWAEI
jgi:transposase